MKDIRKYPFIIIIVLFMAVTAVADAIVSRRAFSELENRKLQQRPPMTWSSLISLDPQTKFANVYETYINDQFVGRDFWISLKSRSERVLGKLENNGVVYGDYGFQFGKEQSYDWWRADINTAAVKTFADTVEIPVDFGLIPSSYAVYSELLPKGLGNIDQYAITDKIYGELSGSVNFVDVAGALQSQKEKNAAASGDTNHLEPLLYYRNDHHWTTNGAYAAYAGYVRSLGLDPVPQKELEPYAKTVENFYGTYSNKSKLAAAIPDEILYYDLPMASVTVDGVEKPSINNDSLWSAHNKYAAFLWDNNGHTVLKRQNLSQEEPSRILLVKDSFSNSFAPFLSLHFDEVHVVDLRYLPTTVRAMTEEIEFERVLVLYSVSSFGTDTYIMRIEK